jgi:hypothetical protein
MTNPPVLDPNYFETHFRTPAPIPDWPPEFVIITAHATTGQRWTTAENESADRRLTEELQRRGAWFARITGYSPRTGHAEPGWAVVLPFDEACDLGLRYRQDAIYHVSGDTLSVSSCDGRRKLVTVGPFRERVRAE